MSYEEGKTGEPGQPSRGSDHVLSQSTEAPRRRLSRQSKKDASRAGSSRRVSTQMQLERKRANDREAQRMARQRIKERISGLESENSELRTAFERSSQMLAVSRQRIATLEGENACLRKAKSGPAEATIADSSSPASTIDREQHHVHDGTDLSDQVDMHSASAQSSSTDSRPPNEPPCPGWYGMPQCPEQRAVRTAQSRPKKKRRSSKGEAEPGGMTCRVRHVCYDRTKAEGVRCSSTGRECSGYPAKPLKDEESTAVDAAVQTVSDPAVVSASLGCPQAAVSRISQSDSSGLSVAASCLLNSGLGSWQQQQQQQKTQVQQQQQQVFGAAAPGASSSLPVSVDFGQWTPYDSSATHSLHSYSTPHREFHEQFVPSAGRASAWEAISAQACHDMRTASTFNDEDYPTISDTKPGKKEEPRADRPVQTMSNLAKVSASPSCQPASMSSIVASDSSRVSDGSAALSQWIPYDSSAAYGLHPSTSLQQESNDYFIPRTSRTSAWTAVSTQACHGFQEYGAVPQAAQWPSTADTRTSPTLGDQNCSTVLDSSAPMMDVHSYPIRFGHLHGASFQPVYRQPVESIQPTPVERLPIPVSASSTELPNQPRILTDDPRKQIYQRAEDKLSAKQIEIGEELGVERSTILLVHHTGVEDKVPASECTLTANWAGDMEKKGQALSAASTPPPDGQQPLQTKAVESVKRKHHLMGTWSRMSTLAPEIHSAQSRDDAVASSHLDCADSRSNDMGADADCENDDGLDDKPKKRRLVNDADKTFECSYSGCGKKYLHIGHLHRHHLNHDPKKILRCDFTGCDHSFVRSDLLVRHQERHMAKGSSFQRKDELEKRDSRSIFNSQSMKRSQNAWTDFAQCGRLSVEMERGGPRSVGRDVDGLLTRTFYGVDEDGNMQWSH